MQGEHFIPRNRKELRLSLLQGAAIDCNLRTLKFLMEQKADCAKLINPPTALHLMAAGPSLHAREDCIEFLLQLKIDVNATDRKGRTALQIASGRPNSLSDRKIKFFRALLHHGGDLNVPDQVLPCFEFGSLLFTASLHQ